MAENREIYIPNMLYTPLTIAIFIIALNTAATSMPGTFLRLDKVCITDAN